MKNQSFREVIVWQKAHALTLAIYTLTKKFSPDELYGLTSQLRRAAASISANFVEGYRKQGTADKLRYYNIAQASAGETLYHLILATTSTSPTPPLTKPTSMKSPASSKATSPP